MQNLLLCWQKLLDQVITRHRLIRHLKVESLDVLFQLITKLLLFVNFLQKLLLLFQTLLQDHIVLFKFLAHRYSILVGK